MATVKFCSKTQFLAAYKVALRKLAKAYGYSPRNRIPKDVRVMLQNQAHDMVGHECGYRTSPPPGLRRRGRGLVWNNAKGIWEKG
jgi:hypothetical protein